MKTKRERLPRVKAAETIEIETTGGATVVADVREPPWRTKKRGTFVLLPALGGTRADFEAAHFAVQVAALGFRTVAFDRSDDATYDDLVLRQLPTVLAMARARNRPPNGLIVVLGHSLGGHAALASQAIGTLGADAVVSVAGCPWVPELEPSKVRSLRKRYAMRVLDEAFDRRVSLALRILGLGHGDSAATYAGAISQSARRGEWTSDDGAHDYLKALSTLGVPVLVVASEDDTIACPPACAAELVRRCGARASLEVLARSDDATRIAHARHRELVTGEAAAEVVRRIARWLDADTATLGPRS